MDGIPWELIISPIIADLLSWKLKAAIEKLKHKKILKEEFEKRVVPKIKKIVEITNNMKDAYVKLAEEEYDCSTFKNKIVGGNRQVMQITLEIIDITLDIYSKHAKEFKNVAKPKTIATLDDMEYKEKEGKLDIIEMMNEYLSDKKNVAEMRKNTNKILSQLFDDKFWRAYNKLMSDESKKECVEETGKEVMKLYDINDEFMGNVRKVLGGERNE